MPGSKTSPPPADALIEARLAFDAGRLDLARRRARAVAAAQPERLEAAALWGVAAAESGAYAEAIAPLAKVREREAPGSPRWILLTVQLGRALCLAGFWADGARRLDEVEAAFVSDPILDNRIGSARVAINQAGRGLPRLRAAVAGAPRSAAFRNDLGWALANLGEIGEAREAFAAALRLRPDFTRAWLTLADLDAPLGQDDLARLERLAADPRIDPLDGRLAAFALFRALDRAGEVDRAWPVLARANVLARRGSAPWSAARDRRFVDALIETFPDPPPRLAVAPRTGSPIPIFVVGLPRTGTTLVERVLAAHSGVHALGEPPTLPRLLWEAAGRPAVSHDAAMVRRLRGIDWPRLGAAYRDEAAALSSGALFTVDKLPFNLAYVGAIRQALPDAVVVSVAREPMDALFSAYKSQFADGGWYGWSYDLGDLAAHFASHRRLADHWRRRLGSETGAYLHLAYEALVGDADAEITRLLAACGLAFEAACLRPHAAPGPVSTLSSLQIRQPISPGRIGAWRSYEGPLEPLRRAVETPAYAVRPKAGAARAPRSRSRP